MRLPRFSRGRSLLDAMCELNRWVFSEFTYDPHSSDIATPLLQVTRERRGVCQDFANVFVRALRVSGPGGLRSHERSIATRSPHPRRFGSVVTVKCRLCAAPCMAALDTQCAFPSDVASLDESGGRRDGPGATATS